MAGFNWLDLSDAKRELAKLPRRRVRTASGMNFFSGAASNRLTEDWATSILSRDQKLWNDLRKLRARCRELADNDSTAAKYLSMCVANIVGPVGFTLQAKVKLLRGDKLATSLNAQIEEAWEDWCGKGVCCVDGKSTFLDVEKLFIRTAAKDGECLVQKIRGTNEFNFALKFIDADQLDHTFFIEKTQSGTEIRQGVEIDPVTRRPVAYWVWTQHPSEWSSGPRLRKRIPADQLIHAGVQDSPEQTRYVPWMASVMWDMNMLRGYIEGELVAARTAAQKMGFLQTETNEQYQGEDRNADGSIAMEASAGSIETLPPGMKFQEWSPQHPTAAFPDFVKTCKRNISAGLNVSYNSLFEDLEGVNFSSIRAGLLGERDNWKVKQEWMKDAFLDEVKREFLRGAYIAGKVDLSAYELDEVLEQIEFHGRRWPWVDPLKDVQAFVLARQNGLASISDELAEHGKNFEPTIDRIAYENEYAQGKKVVLGTDLKDIADTASDDQQTPDAGAPAGKPNGSGKPAPKRPN